MYVRPTTVEDRSDPNRWSAGQWCVVFNCVQSISEYRSVLSMCLRFVDNNRRYTLIHNYRGVLGSTYIVYNRLSCCGQSIRTVLWSGSVWDSTLIFSIVICRPASSERRSTTTDIDLNRLARSTRYRSAVESIEQTCWCAGVLPNINELHAKLIEPKWKHKQPK